MQNFESRVDTFAMKKDHIRGLSELYMYIDILVLEGVGELLTEKFRNEKMIQQFWAKNLPFLVNGYPNA